MSQYKIETYAAYCNNYGWHTAKRMMLKDGLSYADIISVLVVRLKSLAA